MSSRASASLAIEISPWPGRVVLIAASVVGVLGLIYSLTMVLAIPGAAIFLCAVAWQAWRLGLLGRRYQVQLIRCDSEGQWWLHPIEPDTSSLSPLSAQLRVDSRVWRSAVWLGWNTEAGRRWVLLLRRNCHPQLWRQMQSRLRVPQKPPAGVDLP